MVEVFELFCDHSAMVADLGLNSVVWGLRHKASGIVSSRVKGVVFSVGCLVLGTRVLPLPCGYSVLPFMLRAGLARDG